MTSLPVYVSPKILFGTLGVAVLLLLGLALWKSLGRSDGGAPVAGLQLRAGQNVRMNLSAADWATLSLPSEIPAGTLLKSSSDDRNVLALADGSSIRLDRDTSLKIVSIENSGSGQKVHLRLFKGRLFVNEAPASDVTVETKFVSVVPIGTRFAVSQLEKADMTESTTVQVVEGAVRVSHLEDKEATLIVDAGERATAATGSLESPRSDTKDDWIAWNASWTDLDKMPRSKARAASATPAATAGEAAAPQSAPAPAAAQPAPQPAPPPPAPEPISVPPSRESGWVEPNSPYLNNGQQPPEERPRPAPTRRQVERTQPAPAPEPVSSPPPVIRRDRPLPPSIPIEDATGGGQHAGERSNVQDRPLPPGSSGPGGTSTGSSTGIGASGRSPLDAVERRGGVPNLEERKHPDY